MELTFRLGEQSFAAFIDATVPSLRSRRLNRQRAPVHGPKPRRPSPARRMPDAERGVVLSTLHEARFIDLAPAEVHAILLAEKRYLCSVRTMHRILAENVETRERRDVLRHPNYKKPELLATGPNQLWSWDIVRHEAP